MYVLAALNKLCFQHRALQDDAELRLPRGQLDRLVEQRLIGDEPGGFNAAGGGDDRLGGSVINANGQFLAGKSTEDDAMDSADPGACEHGDQRFRHHRHVDDDPIARRHSLHVQHAGNPGDLMQQFAIAYVSLRPGNGTVVYDCRLITSAGVHMNIDGVVAGIRYAVGIPAIKRRIAFIQQLLRRLVPEDVIRRLLP